MKIKQNWFFGTEIEISKEEIEYFRQLHIKHAEILGLTIKTLTGNAVGDRVRITKVEDKKEDIPRT